MLCKWPSHSLELHHLCRFRSDPVVHKAVRYREGTAHTAASHRPCTSQAVESRGGGGQSITTLLARATRLLFGDVCPT